MSTGARTDSTSMTTIIIPPPGEFNMNASSLADEWKFWQMQFMNFLEVNKITKDDIRLKIFFNVVGQPIAKFIAELPDVDNIKTIQDADEAVTERFKQEVNKHSERLKFRAVMREPRESLMEFATRLNGLSRDCDFDNYSRDDAHLEVILKVAPAKIHCFVVIESLHFLCICFAKLCKMPFYSAVLAFEF